MINKKILFLFTSTLFCIFLNFNIAVATCKDPNLGSGVSGDSVELCNPLDATGKLTPQQLIGRIIKGVLGLVGSLALAMFIYGGFTWMLAAGNSTNVEKGKQILIWATIGLIVIFSSYALVQFVFKDVLGVT